MRTRHGHQVTLLALSKLQFDAWQATSQNDESLEAWRKRLASTSPTFKYWDIIYQFEILMCIFIRAQRTGNFNLYLDVLEALVPWFFALDHINYARWIPVHIRDMKSLPDSIKDEFQRFWVVQKTSNVFSSIPIDQAHEQNNCLVKGAGGAVGLTENPNALKRWTIAGPEQARILTEFEGQFMESKKDSHKHHEQTPSLQQAFKKMVNQLSEIIKSMGNPFLEDCPELLALDTRNCMNDVVVATVQNIERLGIDQYQKYVTEVLKNRDIPIQQPIKKNSLTLFKRPLPRKSAKGKEALANLKKDCYLFSHLYGNLGEFFCHENLEWPPSLSENGKLRLPPNKADLLKFIGNCDDGEPPVHFHAKVFDGPAILHMLPTETVKTFNDYCNNLFLPWIESAHQSSDRVDIVWDVYEKKSLKESTREKRGKGIRRKVSGTANLPSNFKDFLRDSTNKQELCDFLTERVSETEQSSWKEVYITSGMYDIPLLTL